jgi:predicted acylesterase/phospholipase RssA
MSIGEELIGGLFGYGLNDEVIAAYQWLIDNYNSGDELFVFGFSRGAFTARSVAGLISRCGVNRRRVCTPIGVLGARERKTLRRRWGGAFGAGVLNGWSESGARPEFTVVSGVSTGALIAPFAFLGPDYDDRLRQIYTNGEAQRLIGQPNPLGALFGSGVLGPERLRRLVGRYLDDDLIRAIAREDRKGRRLLVVTTNLDAQRAVVWDMGAMAASGDAKAFELIRDVLAASASVPVVFAPQLITVEADGKFFQEMHADGTLSAPVYTLPDAVLFGGKPVLRAARPTLYVIVNARIDPGFAVVPDQVEAIAAQSISTLNRVGAKAVLAQTYNVAIREGLSFHLTYVDRDHPDSGGTGFETDAMRQLYDYGYQKARSGASWVTNLSQIEAAKDTGKAAAVPIIR